MSPHGMHNQHAMQSQTCDTTKHINLNNTTNAQHVLYDFCQSSLLPLLNEDNLHQDN